MSWSDISSTGSDVGQKPDQPAPVPRPASLIRRLYKDINEISKDPYPGVEIFAHDDTYTKLCMVLTPQKGTVFAGLRLHFNVELPANWPASPPVVSCSHGLKHPNVFMGWHGPKKGAYICCDLLKEVSYNDWRTWDEYSGGYTPAYTLKALSLQLLSFFSSTHVEQEGGYCNFRIGNEIETSFVFTADILDRPISIKEKLRAIDTRPSNEVADLHQEFVNAVKSSSKDINRTYQIFRSDPSQLAVKAGTWQGWLSGDAIQYEAEVVRLRSYPSTTMIRYRNPRWIDAYKTLRNWSCKSCKYNEDGKSFVDRSIIASLKRTLAELDGRAYHAPDEDPGMLSFPTSVKSIDWKQEIFEGSSASQPLEMLHNEILLGIAEHLSTESIHNFGSAYARFGEVVQNAHIVQNRELQCYFLRTSLNDPSSWPKCRRTILGIGLQIDGKNLKASFDWLSAEAFEIHRVRRNADRSFITNFLPLAFSQAHFQRAQPFIWSYLQTIQTDFATSQRMGSRNNYKYINNSSPSKDELLTIIYKLMNSTVVQLSAAGSSSTNSTLFQASEKAVTAYSQLFYLLICLVKSDTSLRKRAYESIERFCKTAHNRSKDKVPDLGELIIKICMVNATTDPNHPEPHMRKSLSWPNQLVGPFLEETFTRNVLWLIKDQPDLAVLETGDSLYRRQVTFQRSLISIRLVMFQTYFLRFFVGNIQKYPNSLEQNYGFPPASVPEMVVREIKAIYQVDSWPQYFRKIGYFKGMTWTASHFSEMLRGRVVEADRRGRAYYPNLQQSKGQLIKSRRFAEPTLDLTDVKVV